MISKFTALSAFVGLMFFSAPAAAQSNGQESAHLENTHQNDAHNNEAHGVESDTEEAHSESHGHGAFVPA